MNSIVPVNEGNYDVLDIDVLMELSTGPQEWVKGLKMELIWEDLTKQKTGFEMFLIKLIK